MTRTLAEILILIPTALETGLLIFIAGVIQGVMDDLDEATFKRFLTLLHHHALKSPYAVAVASITSVAMVPYLVFYRFQNWWFVAGLALWTAASIFSKIFNLPIYGRVEALDSSDVAQLKEERQRLRSANVLRAAVSFASVVLMVIGLA